MRCSVFVSLVVASVASAGDWWEFRGPDGTGRYTGPALPLRWGPDQNVVWKADVPGLGWSSPVLVKGKLVLTTAVESADSFSLRALAVDAASGKPLWDKELFVEDKKTVPQPHKKNSHASPTPVSDGEKVWVHYGHMGTACLDLDGTVVWKNQDHPYKHINGNGGSPILVGDKLVFATEGTDVQRVIALDKATGKEAWKADLTGSKAFMKISFTTAQAVEVNGATQVIVAGSDYVAGYDATYGREVWRAKYPAGGFSNVCRPVIGHGFAYICTGYATAHLIAVPLDCTGDVSAKITWKVKKSVPLTPTPLLAGDLLYTVSDQGVFTCYDAKTGQVHYQEQLKGTLYSASPIVANDQVIYVTSENGVGTAIAVGKEFKTLGGGDMKEKTFATFVPDDGALYVRTESKLYKIK
jgi:outer membrane protein assembly factor BamB